jgi:hypothetical protein
VPLVASTTLSEYLDTWLDHITPDALFDHGSRLLGHSDPGTTLRVYAHMVEGRDQVSDWPACCKTFSGRRRSVSVGRWGRSGR